MSHTKRKNHAPWLIAGSCLALLTLGGALSLQADSQPKSQLSTPPSMAQATKRFAPFAKQTAYVKAASDEKALAATKKLSKSGKIKGGVLTLTLKATTAKGIAENSQKAMAAESQVFNSKAGQAQAKVLNRQTHSLGIDTLTKWAMSAQELATLQKGQAFSAYITKLKQDANWENWSPELQELFESGNAPLDATIHITPKKGETASSSSAVENLQQIYSGELVKYIPLAERGKIFNTVGLKKFSQTPFVDASGDAAVFLKAKTMQGKASTQALLTQILKAKTLDEAMRASLKEGLATKESTPNSGTLPEFLGGLVAHADSTNFSASGSGWVIQADGNFTATSNQATDYFVNDPSGDGGGWVLAPNGRYYPSYCIDIADGGANESSSYVLNTVNNGNNGLTSGANAGNIANLLPSDPTSLNDLMDLLYAATEVALAGNSQGVDAGTAQNLTANVAVVEEALNAAHGTFGSFAKMTDSQIMAQSSWAGTWIGDNWSKITAQMTSDQKNAQGTAGPSATSNDITLIGMGNADTKIKAPDASSLSEKMPLKSSDGNAELYVGDNGNLWVKALKPTNGTVTFPKIETKGTAGTSLGTAPFYIADKANNAEGAGLQTRLAPVGLFKAGTPQSGTINVSIKMLAMGENKGQKVQSTASYPTGLSQAGAVLEVENVETGKRLKATDAIDPDDPIKASSGTLTTGSDGNLQLEVGTDGKYGLINLPIADDKGNYDTYRYVEVKAPKGEALSAPDEKGTFSFSADDTIDSATHNLETPGTTIQDRPMVETGIAKIDADTAFQGTNGKPDLSGAELSLYVKTSDSGTTVINGLTKLGTFVPVKQSQGIDPNTGKSAAVALSADAHYASTANGNIVLVTNQDGQAGKVMNLALPSADDLYWFETKTPKGFANNPDGLSEHFERSNAIDAANNNLEDDHKNSGTISDKPMLALRLDKNSTNAEFDAVLGKATYEAVDDKGTPLTVDEGLDPKTGAAASIDVTTGTLVKNDQQLLEVEATSEGKIALQNIDGTKVSGNLHFVEVSPADGHAKSNTKVDETMKPDTYNSDGTNFEASATTTDKPMGELALTKIDADTKSSTTQGAARLQGATLGIYAETSTSGTTVIEGVTYSGTLVPVDQSAGVNPQTGESAQVSLSNGGTYAKDANGKVVLVSDAKGNFGEVQNLDLSQNLTYYGIELQSPYGYTRNTKAYVWHFTKDAKVDSASNNYEDSDNLKGTIADRVVDFDFMFDKVAGDNGATGLKGSGWTLTPVTGTTTAENAENTLGKFNNSEQTNLIGRDTMISPDTGFATPVTKVSQLYLGATQFSHNFTDPQGALETGMVEFDHVQAGKYIASETTVPDGETKAHDMEVDILPDGTPNGAPDDYEFKVTDETTHHVLTDQDIPVAYDPTKDGLLLLDDNNLLGKFNLGQIKDNPIVPPTLTTNAFDEMTNKITLGMGQVTIGDNVSATNVASAKTLTGVLVDSSGNPVKDSAGNVIQKSETVSADNQGNLNTTLVLPPFDDETTPNAKFTVEETLLDETGKVLVEDKNYQNNPTETVTVGKVPTFSTQLSDNVLKFGNNVLQDKVSGSGYEAGQQVQINVDGMVDSSTNKVLPATGSAVLTADDEGHLSGEVSVNVAISDASLAGHNLTALESAFLVINGKVSTKPVAKSDNPTDKNETGTVTKVPDGATQVSTATVQVGQNTIEDNYQSSNGSYVSGTQVLVKAGEWDVTKNKAISATGKAPLTADENGKLDGKIPVTFTLDNSEMGDTIVTTEAAYLVVNGKPSTTPVVVNDSHTDKQEMVQLPDFQPHKEDTLIAGTDKKDKLILTTVLEDLQELEDDRQNISNFGLTNQNWDLTTDETPPTYQAEVTTTAKNPAVNRPEQNLKMNNNNRNVLLGQIYDFPLMLDVRHLNQSAQETEIQMTDLLPTQYLNLLLNQVTIRNSEGQALSPSLYTVTAGKETKGKTPITIAFKATKEIKNANGQTVKIVDTTKIPLGERYFIDLPVSVKDSTPQGTKIINTANETLLDTSGHQVTKATETRQNQVVTPSGSTKVEQKTLKPVKDATYVDDWTSDKDRPLTVGQTYTVKVPDFIWDKTTNQEVKATGSVTFVATAPVMTVKVPVKLDASGLAGHDLVTMEDLFMKDATTKKDIKVGQFRDKNAASETVHVEKPNVPQTPQSPQTPKNPLQILTSVLPKTGDKGGGLLVALGALILTSVAVLKRKALVGLKRKLRRKLKK